MIVVEAPEPEPAPIAVPVVESPLPSPAMKRHWYGWQTLIVDGLSIAAMPVFVGFGTYVLAAPIVHAAHGNWARAGLSLAARVGMPGVAAGIGGFVGGCLSNSGASSGAPGNIMCPILLGFGAIVGALGAISVDAGVLAYEDVPVSKLPPTPPKPVEAFLPLIVPREHGAQLMLGATF